MIIELKVMLEKYIDRAKAIYIVFINIEKVFGNVDWNMSFSTLKSIEIGR